MTIQYESEQGYYYGKYGLLCATQINSLLSTSTYIKHYYGYAVCIGSPQPSGRFWKMLTEF